MMGAFDTPITPTGLTPANTSEADLFTATAPCSVLVDVANILTTTALAKVGVTPSGGSVHWKVFDLPIAAGDSMLAVGPLFLETGDAIRVRSSAASSLTFSVTGVESS
jgi:hypothetical protein